MKAAVNRLKDYRTLRALRIDAQKRAGFAQEVRRGAERINKMMERPSPDQILAAKQQGMEMAIADQQGRPSGSLAPKARPSEVDILLGRLGDPKTRSSALAHGSGYALQRILGGKQASVSKLAAIRDSRMKKQAAVSRNAKLAEGETVTDKFFEALQNLKSTVSEKGKQIGAYMQGRSDSFGGEGVGTIQFLKGMIKDGLEDPEQRPYVAALIGSVLGGGAMVGAEALSGRRHKQYGNALLTGALGGGAAGGAYGYFSNPEDKLDKDFKGIKSEDYYDLPEEEQEKLYRETVRNKYQPSLFDRSTGGGIGAATGLAAGAGAGALGDYKKWHPGNRTLSGGTRYTDAQGNPKKPRLFSDRYFAAQQDASQYQHDVLKKEYDMRVAKGEANVHPQVKNWSQADLDRAKALQDRALKKQKFTLHDRMRRLTGDYNKLKRMRDANAAIAGYGADAAKYKMLAESHKPPGWMRVSRRYILPTAGAALAGSYAPSLYPQASRAWEDTTDRLQGAANSAYNLGSGAVRSLDSSAQNLGRNLMHAVAGSEEEGAENE